MLSPVITVPEFRGDPEVLALHRSARQRCRKSLTGLDFVAVVTGTVEVSISALDRRLDDLGSLVGFDLPKAKPDGVDCSAARQLDRFVSDDSFSVRSSTKCSRAF